MPRLGRLDEHEALVHARDPFPALDLAEGDGAREGVELTLHRPQVDEGEGVAPVLLHVHVALGGVGGGGLDDLPVGDGDAGTLDEGLQDGRRRRVGDEDVDVAPLADVAAGNAAVGEDLEVAFV